MKHRQSGLSQESSADKAGISVRSGRRIEKGERAEPSQRHWRTRQDPLEGIWDNELLPLLEVEPTGHYRTLQDITGHYDITGQPQFYLSIEQKKPKTNSL